ncbi:MAG: hypothetical protein KDK21_09170, partial [Mesotoga sp.]|nr:hypothetical protein [Mesotoga sp.]
LNVLTNSIQFFLTADDMFIVISLPNRFPGCAAKFVCSNRCGCFEALTGEQPFAPTIDSHNRLELSSGGSLS